MTHFLKYLFKLNHVQFVIPAQAGIQVSDMLGLALIREGIKNIWFSSLRIKVRFRKLLIDWIPAYAGTTGLAKLEVAT